MNPDEAQRRDDEGQELAERQRPWWWDDAEVVELILHHRTEASEMSARHAQELVRKILVRKRETGRG